MHNLKLYAILLQNLLQLFESFDSFETITSILVFTVFYSVRSSFFTFWNVCTECPQLLHIPNETAPFLLPWGLWNSTFPINALFSSLPISFKTFLQPVFSLFIISFSPGLLKIYFFWSWKRIKVKAFSLIMSSYFLFLHS